MVHIYKGLLLRLENPTSEIMKLGQQSQQGWALEKNTLKLATEKENTDDVP